MQVDELLPCCTQMGLDTSNTDPVRMCDAHNRHFNMASSSSSELHEQRDANLSSCTDTSHNDASLVLENHILKSASYAYKKNMKDPEILGDYVIDDARLIPLPENTHLKIIFVEPDSAVHVYKEGNTINGLEDNIAKDGFSKWIGDLSKFGGWLNANRKNMKKSKASGPTTPTPLRKYKQNTDTQPCEIHVGDFLPPPPQHPTVQSYFSSVQSYIFNKKTAHFIKRDPFAIKSLYNAAGQPLDIDDNRAYVLGSNDLLFVINGDSNQIVSNTDTLMSTNDDISNLYSFWRGSAWDKILEGRKNVLQIH